MFADRAKIIIRSGKGGDGHVSFRRELYVPNGGPDGGDGGRGGDVILVVDDHMSTLMDFRYKRKFVAANGENGLNKRCSGKDGENVTIRSSLAEDQLAELDAIADAVAADIAAAKE